MNVGSPLTRPECMTGGDSRQLPGGDQAWPGMARVAAMHDTRIVDVDGRGECYAIRATPYS